MSDESQLQPNLTPIETHAESLGSDFSAHESRIGELEEMIEFLIEESGQDNKFRIELSEYVKELRAEARFIRVARWVFGGLAIFICLFCSRYLY